MKGRDDVFQGTDSRSFLSDALGSGLPPGSGHGITRKFIGFVSGNKFGNKTLPNTVLNRVSWRKEMLERPTT